MRFRPLLTAAAVSTLLTFAAAPAAQADWLGLPGLGAGTADWVREYATDSTKVTMYAATEDDGVFRSTNNGVTWSAFNLGLEGIPGAKNVRTVFTSGTTVYAGTTAGLFKSTGGGAFQPVAQGPEEDPKNPKKLNQAVQAVFTGTFPGAPMLAAVASGGVYRSTDGGATWQKPSPGNGMLASETVWSLGSFMDNGQLLYAATQSGIYVSLDKGSTWTLSNDGITGQTMRAWADDKYPNIYYAGTTDGLYRSITGGLTWTRISDDVSTIRAITQFNGVEKKRIYMATDNGVIAGQTDLDAFPGKTTWRKLPLDGMSPNTEVWGLNSYINTPGTLLAGTHGGGGKVMTLLPPVWAGVKPTISDTTPHKSQKLTVTSNGTWLNQPTEFTYQWQDCTSGCVDIKDATDATFVVPAMNRKYRVMVTAHNDFPNSPLLPAEKESDTTGASAAEPNSLPGDQGGTNTGSIKLTPAGQPQPGVKLTAQNYAFNGPAADSVSIQWYRCASVNSCEKLQGATGVDYWLTDQDVGKHLCFKATGHNASGSKTLDCSGLTFEVLAPNPVQTSPVTIAGNAWVGHALLSNAGTWAYSGMRFERRWMRCNEEGGSCEYIQGEIASTYVIKAADLGKRIKAEITADSNAAGKLPSPVYRYTPLTGVVTAAPVEPEPTSQGGGGNGGGGGGTGGGGQTPPPPGDTVAPVLALKSGSATSMKVTLSEPASLSVEYQRVRAGRKSGKTCKAGAKKGKKCTVVTKVAAVKVSAAAGTTTVKLAKRKLARGDYRLVVTPVDAAGNKGAAKTVKFKVKKQ